MIPEPLTPKERLAVCERCPIYLGGICRKSMGGCNCVMAAKVLLPNAKCPKKKW